MVGEPDLRHLGSADYLRGVQHPVQVPTPDHCQGPPEVPGSKAGGPPPFGEGGHGERTVHGSLE